jgi:CheY-like chemotaxis protein
VTDETQAAESLRQAQKAAESASLAKSAFLANMSHEIRTPLTAILGFADVLLEDGETHLSPAQRNRTIETIRNAGQHLLTLINDILDLSKIEAERMTVERIETPLPSILRDVADLLRPKAEGKGVALTLALGTPIPDRIIADPTRLRQILMNLAGNAVKFTESGRVSLLASVARHENGQRLIIDVEDTGPGMTPAQSKQLFQVFSQADESVARKFGGTGLGLTISRRLAALMGGDVTLVRTQPGIGSCFRLMLPLEAAAQAAMVDTLAASSTVQASPAVPKKLNGRILLAEDGPDNQRLISFHLRMAGATVDIAENGRVALEMIDKSISEGTRYDLIVTDIQMPEMDGYTLARTIRQRGMSVPIIALTANAMAEDRERCMVAGCDDYASKPIDKSAMIATCARWIGRMTQTAGA